MLRVLAGASLAGVVLAASVIVIGRAIEVLGGECCAAADSHDIATVAQHQRIARKSVQVAHTLAGVAPTVSTALQAHAVASVCGSSRLIHARRRVAERERPARGVLRCSVCRHRELHTKCSGTKNVAELPDGLCRVRDTCTVPHGNLLVAICGAVRSAQFVQRGAVDLQRVVEGHIELSLENCRDS